MLYDPKIEKYNVASVQKPRAVAFADFNFFGASLTNKQFNNALDVFDIIYCDGYWLYRMFRLLGFNATYLSGPKFFTRFVKQGKECSILSKFDRFDIETALNRHNYNIIRLPFLDKIDDFDYPEISRLIGSSNDVFVSLGCPKQELFIERIQAYIPEGGSTFYSVGAAVDFALSKEKRAPRVIRWLRLEFLWRLVVSGKKQWKKWKNVPIVLIWFTKKLLLRIS